MNPLSSTLSLKEHTQASTRTKPGDALSILYERQLRATRGGSLYNAFPYPTKISPEAIALFIASHTNPGDTVFDGFAGSGTTGLAALLCEDPPPRLRAEAEGLGLDVQWGARNAVLYELSALGSLVASTLTNPPNPVVFQRAASEMLSNVERSSGWMYDAADVNKYSGKIRYVISSDIVTCPGCRQEVTLWDACVALHPARIGPNFVCPRCAYVCTADCPERLTTINRDEFLGSFQEVRRREPVRVCGASDGKSWSRPPNQADMDLLWHVEREPIPDSVPRALVPWGDLYRRGYHTGMTHVHHFYTRRNLIAFGRLWERTAGYDHSVRQALRFWLLSYNASHSTTMTRVVAKAGQEDLVVTSAQPGVLYVSGLPVEKNIFDGLRRKLETITKAFSVTYAKAGTIKVVEDSSCRVGLPDSSIDYVFTDPPFAGNIPYAEVNFINEAWLGRYTDRTDEIIVSNSQGKTTTEYEELLTQALTEVNRILKPNGRATLVFHSSTADVWSALQNAYTAAGFGVEHASVLNKTQGSFKQVTTNGAVKGDPVLLLAKQLRENAAPNQDIWETAERLLRTAMRHVDPEERTIQRLYSRLVNYCLVNHERVQVDAEAFYRWCARQPDLAVKAVASD